MNRATLLFLLLAAAGCAHGNRSRFEHVQDGWRPPDAHWVLQPDASGKLLSAAWDLRDWTDQGGTLVASNENVRALHFKRVQLDGDLVLLPIALPKDDAQKSVRALMERQLTAMRMSPLFGRLGLGAAQPVAPVAVDGAEAQEAVYELRKPNDYAPVSRVYVGCAKSIAGDTVIYVTYASPPGQFDDGLDEAKQLLRRLRFEGR